MTVKEARQMYFERNGFSESEYQTPWIRVAVKPIPFFFPNTQGRKRAIPFHDLHHVLTGYKTNFLGEAEIGAWELASGCKNFYAAWVLNLIAVCMGFLLGPKRVLNAFRFGRKCKNLYGSAHFEDLLNSSLEDLRMATGTDKTGSFSASSNEK